MTATLSFIVLQGQTVMVRDFRSNSHKWMKGIVLQQLGPVTYTVEVDGKLLKRRVDHLRQRSESASPPESRTDHTIHNNFQYPEPHVLNHLSKTTVMSFLLRNLFFNTILAETGNLLTDL